MYEHDHRHSDSYTDTDTALQTDLQHLEGTHHLHDLFTTFLDDYDTDAAYIEDDTVYVDGDNLDDLTAAFTDRYGDTFLNQNPAISDEELEQYDQMPDTLTTDLTAAMAASYMEAETGEYDPLFSVQGGTDEEQASSTVAGSAYANAGIAAIGTLGILGASISGAAAFDTTDTGPEYDHANASDRSITDDGIPENTSADALESADPNQTDVYVEVDAAAGCNVSPGYFDDVKEMFANAPVENPDGSTGINLHINYSDTVATADYVDINEQNGSKNNLPELKEQYFDNDGKGHHYVAIVPNATNGGEYSGATEGSSVLGVAKQGEFLVTCDDRPQDEVQHTFAHELGHSLGLSSDAFKGTDSEEIPFEQYPSAMNYNDPKGEGNTYIPYSDGTNSPNDHDDWKHIAENLHTPEVDE